MAEEPYYNCDACTPDGPYGSGPTNEQVCDQLVTLNATWPVVWKWLKGISECTYRLDGYVYNSTQRGIYYFEFNGGGKLFADISTPCDLANGPRIFSNPGGHGVLVKYRYSPCGNSSCTPGGFCNSRHALSYEDFGVQLGAWVVDQSYEGNKEQSPTIWWNNPQFWVYPLGGLHDLSECFTIPKFLNEDRYNGTWEDGGGVGSDSFYGAFGHGGAGSAENQKTNPGYWNLSGDGILTYTTNWYWHNDHPQPKKESWVCGQCTYCMPVCSCNGSNGGCSEGYVCGDPHDDTEKCCSATCGTHCGDHDLWQQGNFVITLYPGQLERCWLN